jgi:carboxymethylenebutenolidase
VPDTQVISDLDATIDWAFKSALVNADKVGLTGFCWGGRITWLYAAHNPKLKAGVAWYGRLVGTANELTPKYPIDIASALTVPILGLYGGKDTSIPLNTLNQMRDLLKSSSSKSEIIVYPDAPHAFLRIIALPTARQKQNQAGNVSRHGLISMAYELRQNCFSA